MLSTDAEVRGQLETAIAAVMGFSAVEMERVKVRCVQLSRLDALRHWAVHLTALVCVA